MEVLLICFIVVLWPTVALIVVIGDICTIEVFTIPRRAIGNVHWPVLETKFCETETQSSLLTKEPRHCGPPIRPPAAVRMQARLPCSPGRPTRAVCRAAGRVPRLIQPFLSLLADLAASPSPPKAKPPPPMHGEEYALAGCPLTGWLAALMMEHRRAQAEHHNRMMPPESDPPSPKKAPPPLGAALPFPQMMVVPIPKKAPPPLGDAVPPPQFKLGG